MSTHLTTSDDDASSTETAGAADRDDAHRDVPEEIQAAIADAAARIDDAGEPVTVAKLAGTVLNDGVGPERFKTVARGARRYLKEHDDTDVGWEVGR